MSERMAEAMRRIARQFSRSSSSSIDPSRTGMAHPRAAVAATIFRDARVESVLLVQRGKPPLQGSWSLPGGSVNLGETVAESVRREVLEETGLTLHFDENSFFATTDALFSSSDNERLNSAEAEARKRAVDYHYVLSHAAGVLSDDGVPVAGDDAANLGWFKVASLVGESDSRLNPQWLHDDGGSDVVNWSEAEVGPLVPAVVARAKRMLPHLLLTT